MGFVERVRCDSRRDVDVVVNGRRCSPGVGRARAGHLTSSDGAISMPTTRIPRHVLRDHLRQTTVTERNTVIDCVMIRADRLLCQGSLGAGSNMHRSTSVYTMARAENTDYRRRHRASAQGLLLSGAVIERSHWCNLLHKASTTSHCSQNP